MAVGWAAAPLRPGQPYAEAATCTGPDVILCEDFNYPQNFACTGTYPFDDLWMNPGLAVQAGSYNYGCDGRRINPLTGYPGRPNGPLPSGAQPDHVWVANWDPLLGPQANGATWGILRQAIGNNDPNGMAPVRDFYVRFQYYVTADYAWPGDPRVDPYNYGASNPIDNKILYVFPAEMLSPTDASFDAGLFTVSSTYDPQQNSRFADALAVRIGDAGGGSGYEAFPLCNQCSLNPRHMEYGPFQSLTLRNPDDQALPGRMFRFDTGRWYTIEMRYKLGSAPRALDGTVEVWIDGTKVYSARFNNAGSQVTVLLLQNRDASAVNGHVDFWSGAGVLLGSQVLTLGPRQTLVLNTATVSGVSGQGGSITVAHDGGYGALAGKAVAVEPATGFAFDSLLGPRLR